MFIEIDKIYNLLKCRLCQNKLNVSRVLPCGNTICQTCVESSSTSNPKRFQCSLCSKKHTMPDEGFPSNKIVQKLLSMQPFQVSRGKFFEELRKDLNELQAKISSLSTRFDYIPKNYCKRLRNEVELADKSQLTDPRIYEKALEVIDSYQKACSNRADRLETNSAYKNQLRKT